MAAPRIRVLLVDDSSLCRTLLRHALESDPEIEVVAEAEDGVEALQKVELLRPSLVCLDIQMPRMGGLETIERIMQSRPTPILVVTERPRLEGVDLTFAALSRGALDLVQKPAATLGSEEMRALVARVKELARTAVTRPGRGSSQPAPDALRAAAGAAPQVIGVGASTGGPAALVQLLRGLPPEFEVPILIVQHIDAAFSESFAGWLSRESGRSVRMAADLGRFEPGDIVLAPQRLHMQVEVPRRLRLDQASPGAMHVPSVDVLFHSLAAIYGKGAAGVLLTGMGRDGAEGLLAMRRAGALTIAQDRSTSVVYGMPGAAAELGAASYVAPLSQIPSLLAVAAGIHAPPAAKAEPEAKAPPRRKVLIVDDSPIVLEATRMALEPGGIEVVALDNPLTVAHVVRKETPDLILLDVMMPAVSGEVVARIVGASAVSRKIPVVLFSELPAEELAARAQRCGAAGYIRKGGDEGELLRQVKRWFNG